MVTGGGFWALNMACCEAVFGGHTVGAAMGTGIGTATGTGVGVI